MDSRRGVCSADATIVAHFYELFATCNDTNFLMRDCCG